MKIENENIKMEITVNELILSSLENCLHGVVENLLSVVANANNDGINNGKFSYKNAYETMNNDLANYINFLKNELKEYNGLDEELDNDVNCCGCCNDGCCNIPKYSNTLADLNKCEEDEDDDDYEIDIPEINYDACFGRYGDFIDDDEYYTDKAEEIMEDEIEDTEIIEERDKEDDGERYTLDEVIKEHEHKCSGNCGCDGNCGDNCKCKKESHTVSENLEEERELEKWEKLNLLTSPIEKLTEDELRDLTGAYDRALKFMAENYKYTTVEEFIKAKHARLRLNMEDTTLKKLGIVVKEENIPNIIIMPTDDEDDDEDDDIDED